MTPLTVNFDIGSTRHGRAEVSGRVPNDALDRSDVANLSAQDILRMTTTELVRVVLAGDLPLLNPPARTRLKYNDRATLERLAFLARACCRNRSA